MRQSPPNARFWWLHPTTLSPVKITLRPGQMLRWCCGGPHEEGWSRSLYQWEHTGEEVQEDNTEDGRDCDGRLTRWYLSECPLDQLQEVRKPGCDADGCYAIPCCEGILFPAWRSVRDAQRDYAAEAMGY